MKEYMPLVLWREDFDEIISILKRRAAVTQFETDDYSFETLDELETHFGSKDKTELKIASSDPYVSIELGNKAARLYVSGNNPNASGIFFELDKVLTARQRRFPALYTYWVLLLINIFSIATTIFMFNNIKAYSYITSTWSAVSLVASAWGLWILYVRMRRHSIIRMRRRAATDSFVRRNKDQLTVAIIAAIVGAILGIVGTKLIDKFPIKSAPDQTQGQP